MLCRWKTICLINSSYRTCQYWSAHSRYQAKLIDSNIALLNPCYQSQKYSTLEMKFPLYTTSNGLHSIHIITAKQLLERNNPMSPHDQIILLRTTEEKTNNEIVVKLHWSFAHPSIDKSFALINNSNSRQKKRV